MNAKTFAAIIGVASVLVGCEFNLWGPGVSDVSVCEKANPLEGCEKNQNTFKTTTPKIFATAKLDNAVEGTKVKVLWRLNQGQKVKNVRIYEKEFTTKLDQKQITSALAPAKVWLPGTYEVSFVIVGDESKRESEKFQIK
ncbi:hypothetical protein IQ264_22120 [Phormidium sp. LEGE 05292]|uniref:hypothetical protein n=1 Tax=[Phormidium] sp. LEGE 05292 TaxID=767427 RepID=UPI0018809181|nr:hypothetical protein [Phormidium sp. LEGE 05292]MBE9228122.1 hypothetical protein [Phormidium sp. LEGE 05292]